MTSRFQGLNSSVISHITCVFIQRFPIPNHNTSLQKITVAETGGNATSTGQSWCPNGIVQKTYCTEQLIHTNKIKQESLYSLHSSVAEKGKTYATASIW